MRPDDQRELSLGLLTACCPNCKAMSLTTLCVVLLAHSAFAQTPPVLNTVFPASGQSGTSVEVAVSGSNLKELETLHCGVPGVQCEQSTPNCFRLTIPADAQPGLYDVWAVGDNGVSAPRTFAIGNRPEQTEIEPNESTSDATIVPLNNVINGQIDKAGDVDCFRFEAKEGQRVVVECWAERMDSRLRAVLEIYDSSGKRIAVNRGYFGLDPLIDFRVPTNGVFVVKVHDLISSGSAEHYYRLDIDTGPRVAFSIPTVVERGKHSRVTLYGWNLKQGDAPAVPQPSERGSSSDTTLNRPIDDFDSIEVEIPASLAEASWPLPVGLQPAQAVLAGAAFPFCLPGSHAPVLIGITDVPVIMDQADNHSPMSAQMVSVPCDVSGQLVAGDERDWFAIDGRRGEVFFIEALGQRIGSPVDLQISVHGNPEALSQANGAVLDQPVVLSQFADETRTLENAFSTSHLDPAGRFVCPADGRFLIAVQNLTGGLYADPRRTYRLCLRREEPDFQIVAIPQSGNPVGLNLQRGGREALQLLAIRRRGWEGSIRVSAKELPGGVECPDVWLGPNVHRTTLVVSADPNAAELFGELRLQAHAEDGAQEIRREVHGGTIVRPGTPNGWGRIVSKIPLAISGDSRLRITANGHETVEHHLYGVLPAKHSPGGVLDVALRIERDEAEHQAPVKLIGTGLPDLIPNQSAIIPADQATGYLSFQLPPTLPTGRYSLVIRAETTVPTSDAKTESIVVYSNPVTIDVKPAAFLVEVDPFAVNQARRGETIQIGYSARRVNGFIGKMHTELAVPGLVTNVPGLRGRGETFTGQTDSGSLQIVINDDAPLGPQPFLRLFTVGVVEDEPIYQGSRFLSLEIVE
ncbi:MAG: PPC domain-containing protein [Planctomycetota bacterium]|nr:PPC domain-containing protein [Planctomycetota bacterium]